MLETFGQIFGWLATIFGFISYQCKTKKQLLIILSASGLCMCTSYLLLGAYSGMLLNVIGLARNFIYAAKDKRLFSYKWWPPLLAAIMGFVGILSWQGPVSLLIISGLILYSLFLAAENVQNLRRCILFTSTLIGIYNIYYRAWGGVFFEIVSIISALIGLYRFRKQKTAC